MKKIILAQLIGLVFASLANASGTFDNPNMKTIGASDSTGDCWYASEDFITDRVLKKAVIGCYDYFGSIENCDIHQDTVQIFHYNMSKGDCLSASVIITRKITN